MGNDPHPVDIYAGQILRDLRTNKGMNQKALGAAIDPPVTFQQIQKYERGSNRMSASRLHEFAKALDAPESIFFPGDDDKPIPTYTKKEAAIVNALRGMPEEVRISIADLILYIGKNGL